MRSQEDGLLRSLEDALCVGFVQGTKLSGGKSLEGLTRQRS